MAIRTRFDYKHYVPILRFKPAEMHALRFLAPEDKRRMTPLLELLPSVFAPKNIKDTRENPFLETVKHMAVCWGQYSLFVDINLIYTVFKESETNHELWQLSEAARRLHLSIIPVTGINRSQTFQAAVEKVVKVDHRGVCIRLMEADLNSSLERELQQLLARFELQEKQ